MGDFEPRMDKWRSGPVVEDLGLQFKDAILNKNRLEQERRAATREAQRRARWKRSLLGRFLSWVWRMIGMALATVTLLLIPFILFLGWWLS